MDEGGFDLKLPPNRFRTRSIAIIAGYSPERLYSNMPPGAFVVESGVYKVGADRDYVKSEPIYWKQVVYGSRAESDGSGTYPRNPAGKVTARNTQILHGPRAVAANSRTSLVRGPDLELQGGSTSLRASSPLEQGKPLVDWLSPVNNYSDISSVPHLSSAERSFPSTLLTNPHSSISSPYSPEQSSGSRSRSAGNTRLSSLHTIPEDSRFSVTADIHHISQYSNLSEYTSGYAAAAQLEGYLNQGFMPGNETPRSSQIRHHSTRIDLASLPGGEWSRARDISYPGHQIGLPYYPAPVHRAISPSTQYPPPAQAASHIQPPQIPDIRVRTVDPKEVDIYQRIAKLDPETNGRPSNIRPLATSSPPGKRKREAGNDYINSKLLSTDTRYYADPSRKHHPSGLQQSMPAKAILSSNPASPNNLGLPGVQQEQHQQQAVPQTSTGQTQQPRKLSKSGQRLRDRETRLQTLRELSENESSTKGDDGDRRDYDLISVVSEGLDAEVTAITSSSSPGSSGTNTLQPGDSGQLQLQLHQNQEDRNNRTSSSSGIASKNTSSNTSNQTGSSSLHSTSASLHQSSSLNQSSSLDLDKRLLLEDGIIDPDDSTIPYYENWPPRPYKYSLPPTVAAKPTPPLYDTYRIESSSSPLESGVPPLVTHTGKYIARMTRVTGSSPDSSMETPPSRGASRPNSSQSAPLDRSVDRHYEWDSGPIDDSTLAPLPPEWATRRRSPAYNPRRDRDIGPMVQANRDRVFSDSEIYSNVFPRRGLQIDVEARVRAMKKEFKEYRETMNKSPKDSPTPALVLPVLTPADTDTRLESLI